MDPIHDTALFNSDMASETREEHMSDRAGESLAPALAKAIHPGGGEDILPGGTLPRGTDDYDDVEDSTAMYLRYWQSAKWHTCLTEHFRHDQVALM